MRLSAPIAALRDASWLTAERAVAWAWMLLAVEMTLLGIAVAWHHGLIVAHPPPSSIDFLSFHAAGKLALAGSPALAYDQAAHHAAEQAIAGVDTPYQFFFYPPVFLLLCAGLAKLPYLLAYGVFEAITLGLFVVAARAVLNVRGWQWVVPVLAFPAVLWNVGLGQNAFLSAALFGGFTLLLDRRPVRAGLLLGLLCYKPHFGVLAPVALLAARRWAALAGAVGAVAGLIGLSVLLFGWESWRAYLDALAGSGAMYASGRIQFAGMLTPFGAARLLGLAPRMAWGVQAGAMLTAAAAVAWVWWAAS